MDDPTIEPDEPATGAPPARAAEAIFRDRPDVPLDELVVEPPQSWSLGSDLADLPRLVRSRAIVVPFVLIVVSSVVYMIAIRTPDVLVSTIATILAIFFLALPPVGSIVLAALLADRSSYLAGAIAGFLGPVGLTLAIVGGASGQVEVPADFLVAVLVQSTGYGLIIGGVVSLVRTGWRRLTRG